MATISAEDKKYLLSIKQEDIDAKLMNYLFANTASKVNGKLVIKSGRFKQNDTFTLEKGEYFNKEKVVTNVGLFIFNKFLFEGDLEEVVGYVNEPISAKVYENIENKLASALLEDRITTEMMVTYLNKIQWLSFTFTSLFSASITMTTLKPDKELIKSRDKMFKENKESIEAGDVIVGANIEKQLKDEARKKFKGDPGMNVYNSGARGSFDNNYKNIAIMKGPVYDSTNKKWDIVQTSLIEGIEKKDIPSYGSSVVNGAYPKAVGTQVSGYYSKQLTAAFQGVVVDKPGTDCGTKGYVNILLTPWLAKDVLYSYIIDKGKLVMLSNENMSKYMNTMIKLRTPMFCINEKICQACAGKSFELLGIENAGLTTTRISSRLLRLNMKKFHDSTAKISKIDLNSITI